MNNFTFSMPKKLESFFPLSGSNSMAFDLQNAACIPQKKNPALCLSNHTRTALALQVERSTTRHKVIAILKENL